MPCHPPKTKADKMWPYTETYQGERNEDNSKEGIGVHHWSGAESQETYSGRMLRDTMHGNGEYTWRYLGPRHIANTYEGSFYNNRMHGYGMMSYPDGRVFNGLFYNNIRWGPGVESHACLREDVGLWYGYQLIRLAWRPAVPSVAIDLVSSPVGNSVVAPHRVLLMNNAITIGEVNSALELLKQCGSPPLVAAENWPKLYPKNCTDTTSQLCHVEAFDRGYFKGQINTLCELTPTPDKNTSESSKDGCNISEQKKYYAWNNNPLIIHMMNHCYTHEEQRTNTSVNIKKVLVGPRKCYKEAGKHELHCRTLLMASYLGLITNVAPLINECDVIPDISDIQGNSAVMYAACGDKPEIIQFLVEAGAEVDACNDACCTPLGIALLRYALEKRDIAYSGMFQALLPPQTIAVPPPPDDIHEWNITRDLTTLSLSNGVAKSPSKLNNKPVVGRRASLKDMGTAKRKSDTPKPESQKEVEATASTSEERRTYNNINNEYLIRVAEAFSIIGEANPIPYIFEVRNMIHDVELLNEEDQKKAADKNVKKNTSKVIKETTRPSRDYMWQGASVEAAVFDTKEIMKQEKVAHIKATILQLLCEGADPRKVRCPQPALFMATAAGCPDLIRQLVRHGADIDEVHPQVFNYTTLDIAVSGPMTHENLSVIHALLDSGANPDYRLKVPKPTQTHLSTQQVESALDSPKDDGPTLLQVVLARKLDTEPEEEIRQQVLELLLEYGCNPITRYKGHSAVEMAMNKSMKIFDSFIKSPGTDLNAIINDLNQTVLVKMFYLPFCKTLQLQERLQTLTNLLLYGADPLIKCQNGKEEYENLFVYVRKVIVEQIYAAHKYPSSGSLKKVKSEMKAKKMETTKKAAPAPKSLGKTIEGDMSGDYKQSLDLVVECARILYIRWLQAKLMKELIDIVDQYKHRSWNMILKEHKNKKTTGLWLTAVRALEIWDVLKTTKKRKYNDKKILKHTLCIIHFYYKRTRKILRSPSLTAPEKELIESEVARFIREQELASIPTPETISAIRPYVTPELTVKNIQKFHICFECAMPLGAATIPCGSCNLITFCSLECMKINIDRVNCHPCSIYLKNKYFPTPEESIDDSGEQL